MVQYQGYCLHLPEKETLRSKDLYLKVNISKQITINCNIPEAQIVWGTLMYKKKLK